MSSSAREVSSFFENIILIVIKKNNTK
jgi:hypothetical protein